MISAATPMQVIRNVYSTTNATTTTWIQLSASLTEQTSVIEIFDSSGAVLQLGYGPSGSEVALPFMILPGGNGRIGLLLNKGMRLALQSVDTTTVSSGQLVLNLYR